MNVRTRRGTCLGRGGWQRDGGEAWYKGQTSGFHYRRTTTTSTRCRRSAVTVGVGGGRIGRIATLRWCTGSRCFWRRSTGWIGTSTTLATTRAAGRVDLHVNVRKDGGSIDDRLNQASNLHVRVVVLKLRCISGVASGCSGAIVVGWSPSSGCCCCCCRRCCY